jgi:hypothetical protein
VPSRQQIHGRRRESKLGFAPARRREVDAKAREAMAGGGDGQEQQREVGIPIPRDAVSVLAPPLSPSSDLEATSGERKGGLGLLGLHDGGRLPGRGAVVLGGPRSRIQWRPRRHASASTSEASDASPTASRWALQLPCGRGSGPPRLWWLGGCGFGSSSSRRASGIAMLTSGGVTPSPGADGTAAQCTSTCAERTRRHLCPRCRPPRCRRRRWRGAGAGLQARQR